MLSSNKVKIIEYKEMYIVIGDDPEKDMDELVLMVQDSGHPSATRESIYKKYILGRQCYYFPQQCIITGTGYNPLVFDNVVDVDTVLKPV